MTNWIFQLNPKRFDRAASDEAKRPRLFNVTRYRDQLHPGDGVAIWQSGPHAGVIGFATIAANEAGKRPLRVKRPGPKGLLDGARLGVDGALPDSERGAEICRRHVRRKRTVAEKINPSQNVDDPARPSSRLSRSEWARALPAQCPGH